MEKVSSTGRETYNSQIGNLVANYTKTTTSNNVVINVEVKQDGETIYVASCDKSNNRFSGSFKQFDAVTSTERVEIVKQVMIDINSII